jgi:hypothetical protein
MQGKFLPNIGIVAAGVAALVGAVILPQTPLQAQVNSGETWSARRPHSTLEARLFTDRTNYNPNRAVQITLTMTNLANQRRIVTTGSNREFDYSVRDSRTNKIVYQLSKHRQQNGSASYSLNGGETRTIRELWDMKDDKGNRVPSGVYVIEGRFYPQNIVSRQIFIGEGAGRPEPPERPSPGNPLPGDPNSPPPRPTPGSRLVSTLTTNRSRVQPGDVVQLTYTVWNRGDAPILIPFSSGKRFDVTAAAPGGQIVWQMSRDMMYTQALSQIEIAPGKQQTFMARWEVNRAMRPGSYTLLAFLTPRTQNAPKGPATLNIVVGNAAVAPIAPVNPGRPGNSGAIGGGMTVTPNPGAVRIVSLRMIASPQGKSLVGQRVTVTGNYLGPSGAAASPNWTLSGEGVTIPVKGTVPTLRNTITVTIAAIVRQAENGTLYLEVP